MTFRFRKEAVFLHLLLGLQRAKHGWEVATSLFYLTVVSRRGEDSPTTPLRDIVLLKWLYPPDL